VGLVAAGLPLPEPDRDQDRGDRQEEERLHDRAHETSVGDYPRERSHRPPTVYRTINPSIGY
jgi:hypothetical protein